MKITLQEIEKYMDLLSGTLEHLSGIILDVDEDRLYYKATSRDWSARDILAHLRSCADVWESSIVAMLANENPTLPDIHPRQWIRQTNYLELRFEELFQALKSQRGGLLSVLRHASFEDWSRSAIIGRRKHTVFSQVRRMAKHEEKHVSQIKALLKS
jgi:hypothetical protein